MSQSLIDSIIETFFSFFSKMTSLTSRVIQRQLHNSSLLRGLVATQAATKLEGDISSVFASLSGATDEPLPERFAQLKQDLLKGREDSIIAGWNRLLYRLKVENRIVAECGSFIIPQIDFKDISNENLKFQNNVQKRGVAVIRGVVPEKEARQFKEDIETYVRTNPSTKAFPQQNPQVFELYWSQAQVKARAHPNLIEAQKYLMKLWHSSPSSEVSTSTPLAYADRVRIRQPGDSGFALGPHQDGGGVERWEPNGYGQGKVYNEILYGNWENYDPWDASGRVLAVSDLYNGAGACSMFRMFQGWLGMSWTAPGEGTLLVNPLLQLSTAYILLRPFFVPKLQLSELGDNNKFLDQNNWILKEDQTSDFPGANSLGHSQELNNVTHPHLDLASTMVHVPEIRPGDYVVWHCDSKVYSK
jgi:Protein of unknown function (DUF1479)